MANDEPRHPCEVAARKVGWERALGVGWWSSNLYYGVPRERCRERHHKDDV